MFTINVGRPRITLRKATDPTKTPDVVEQAEAIFTTKNAVILGAGIALGIILKQQSDIRTLKRTVAFLQEVIR